jgi:sulfur carrier protein ThiS
MSADVIAVGIGTLGQARKEFTLEEGSTVADLLDVSGFSAEGFTFKIAGNGEVNADHVLENGDVVALIPAVKNGL